MIFAVFSHSFRMIITIARYIIIVPKLTRLELSSLDVTHSNHPFQECTFLYKDLHKKRDLSLHGLRFLFLLFQQLI